MARQNLELEGMEMFSDRTKSDSGKKSYLKNAKALKKLIKQQSTFKVKNSRLFQLKSNYDRKKHLKKQKKEEKKRRKLLRQKMNNNNNNS